MTCTNGRSTPGCWSTGGSASAGNGWTSPSATPATALDIALGRLAQGLPAADDDEVTGVTPVPAVAAARPAPGWVTPRMPISSYSEQRLVELVRWLRADGELRLPDDEIRALMTVLGLTRRTANIVGRLEQAMQAARGEGR